MAYCTQNWWLALAIAVPAAFLLALGLLSLGAIM